jgi:hypothetical protein
MTVLRDADELSIDVPDGVESCLVYPENPGSGAAACKAIDLSVLAPPPPARIVAAGAVQTGGAQGVRFALSFSPDTSAVEPTAETAHELAAREVALRTSGASGAADEGGPPGAGTVDILAVGGKTLAASPTGEVVTLGGAQCVRAAYTLDLRERGHDTPMHFVTYGAWSRAGLYTFTVQGEAPRAASIDSFADDAARTLQLKTPAPPAPTDVARLGARMGQMGLIILILLATTLAILGARRRKMRA